MFHSRASTDMPATILNFESLIFITKGGTRGHHLGVDQIMEMETPPPSQTFVTWRPVINNSMQN